MSVGKALNYYVSTVGNDKNPGTKEEPFRTITAAAAAVRGINGNMSADIVVYLREGVYQLSDCIELTEKDSGKNGHRVIYRAYPGENAVISGGMKVSGWQRDTGTSIKNLWKASIPGLENTRNLFVNGRRAERARSEVKETHAWGVLKDPDMLFYNIIEKYKTYMGETDVYEGYKTGRKEMANWRNQRDIEFVYDVGWTHSICPVDEIIEVEDGAVIRMRMPCFKHCQVKGGVRVGSPSYIENAFELLEKQGEWYFDKCEHTLYYIPLDGEDIESSEVIIPVTERLITLKGSLDGQVRNISFEGIEFSYTTWFMPSLQGYAEVQANLTLDLENDPNLHSSFVKPQAGIQLDAASEIIFDGCTFSSMGCTAIDIQNGSCSNIIRGCEFRDISGSGIQLGGFTVGDAHPGDIRQIVKNNVITNNYLHDIGVEYKGSIPVIAGYVSGTIISFNEISNASYSGISVGWGWGYWDEASDERTSAKPPQNYPRFYKPTVAAGNCIEYNHVHHVMQKLHDGAGIYTLSMQAGSVIRGNHVHDNGGFTGERYEKGILVGYDTGFTEDWYNRVVTMKGFPGGIYFDEASGGFEVSGNLIYNVVVPFFYHDVGINGRYDTNLIHDNYFHEDPHNADGPSQVVDKAGLKPEYRYLLNKHENTGAGF